MKKIFPLLIMLNSLSAISQSGWFIQPVGINSFLWEVKMVDLNTVYIAAEGGVVLKTTNGGNNWVSTILPGAGDLFTIDFPVSSVGYSAGSGGKIFKTTNSGQSWNELPSPTAVTIQSSYFINENTGFIAGGSTGNGKIFKTTNGGVNWTEYGPGTIFPQVISINFPSANTGYAAGINGLIMKSTNSGINWNIQQSGLGSVTFFSVFFPNENTGYIVTPFPGNILKTINGGTNWNSVHNDTNHFLVSIYFPTPDTGFAVGGGALSQTVVVKTTNAGASWSSAMFNFNGHLNSVNFINSNVGYISGDQGRLYKTINGGAPVGIAINSTELPDEFKLNQNFPNPFNPQTTIEYFIPEKAFVEINIYNVLGQKLHSILSELQTPGKYSFEWTGDNYNSGIFFYELTAITRNKKFTERKKMILLK